jgi:hypothetical protein
MGRLWSFGRRSARELDAIVARFVADQSIPAPSLPTDVASPLTRELAAAASSALSEALGHVTLAEVTKEALLSTRLMNILRDPDVGAMEVAEFLAPDGTGRALLLRLPNCGRKTLHELERYCRQYAARALASGDSDDGSHPPRAEVLELINAATGGTSITFSEEESEGPEGSDAESLIRWGFGKLKEREVTILTLRYGLDGSAPQTLEEVASPWGLTRERIRQIEAKALRKLQRMLLAKLSAALDEAATIFWEGYEGDFIPAPGGGDFRRELPPFVRLCLDISGTEAGDWIRARAVPASYGVLRPGADVEALSAIAEALERAARSNLLPTALCNLADADTHALDLAARAETRLFVAEGYLFERKPHARMKRAVRAHAILADAGRALSLEELAELYWTRTAGDACSLRDLVIVMEALPHLFIELDEGVWAGIGRGGTPPPCCYEVPPPKVEPEVDSSTLAGAIRDALIERGPTSLGDLYRDGDKIVPPGRSRISIGPILLGRPELFLRVLPGVYALQGRVPTQRQMVDEPVPFLLNAYQGRVYAFARRGGEAWGTFPLWTVEAEYRLCRWARFEAEDPLFRSLLAIASIDEWPVSDPVKNEWRRLADQRARFELAPPRSLRPEPRPPLDRLLAAAVATRDRGNANWLLFNRIMGRRIDSVGGRSLLGLMLALGALEPPVAQDGKESWQLPHTATERAARLAEELGDAMARAGELDWSSPIGKEIAARALSAEESRLGWASLDGVDELLNTEAAPTAQAFVDDEDEDALFDRLMQEHRRVHEAQKRDTLAQWLLDD